jgi:hypothetical protein
LAGRATLLRRKLYELASIQGKYQPSGARRYRRAPEKYQATNCKAPIFALSVQHARQRNRKPENTTGDAS